MTAGPISTPLAVAQCQKCDQYVFKAQVNGCDTTVDVLTLPTLEEWRTALVAGKSLYVEKGGKKLGPVYAKQIAAAAGAGYRLYATHGCTAGAVVRATEVEAPPPGPRSAPVMPGGPQGGFHHPTAPADGSQGHRHKINTLTEDYWGISNSPAANATPRPSRCAICRKLLTGKEEGVTTIEFDGRIIWGIHDHG